jgi:alkanesulfonate monooxygenase SsuD/methylene tetrahydromethanopterin reductase-like flavin-dependent oxidoreductase (luciferase family)
MSTELRAGRPLKVGVQVPEVERPVFWPELAAMARSIEAAGFDSIWVGDHFMYRRPDEVVGPWDAWSLLASIAAVTSRVEIGPLVTPLGFYNPAVLAKKAVTVDEISGGRLIVGVGAGWYEPEFRAYGVPYEDRIGRFEEAFTILRTLLQEGAIDFEGRFYSVRDCELVPRARPGGPPLMIGSTGPRMLRSTLRHVASWNAWFDETGNRPDGVAALRRKVAAACFDVGRDPDTVEASVAVLVRLPGGSGRVSGDGTRGSMDVPLAGPPEVIAESLRAYARAGVGQVQLVLDPITVESIEALAPALELLDRGMTAADRSVAAEVRPAGPPTA